MKNIKKKINKIILILIAFIIFLFSLSLNIYAIELKFTGTLARGALCTSKGIPLRDNMSVGYGTVRYYYADVLIQNKILEEKDILDNEGNPTGEKTHEWSKWKDIFWGNYLGYDVPEIEIKNPFKTGPTGRVDVRFWKNSWK